MSKLARALLVASMLLAALTYGWQAPDAQALDTSPEAWAKACQAGKSLKLAPIIADDKAPDGALIKRTPDSRGRYVPVIFVHGWTSKADHTSERTGSFSHKIDLTALVAQSAQVPRSLIGQIQGLGGAVAFTYDYGAIAGRWVTDDGIGPSLGEAIDCLHQASGERVIVVGHSMGGLAARQAIGRQSDGSDRADKVSTVVTFGTPEQGSLLAQAIALTADGAALARGPATVLRALLATCGAASSEKMETDSLCDALPAFVSAFDGDAGKALRVGSEQLAQLPAFPDSVNLVALAGNSKFAVADNVFLWTSTSDVNTGDLIVLPDSAKAGADFTDEIDCRFQLNPARAATDTAGVIVRLVAGGEAAQPPWQVVSAPCFHTQLMRDIGLTNTAMGAIVDDIASRQDNHGEPPQLGIPAAEFEDPTGTRTPIVVVLDISGSMGDSVNADTASGSTPKIDAAKAAVLDLIDKSDPDQELGIVAYPGGSAEIEGCSSGQVITPLGQIDKTSASLAVRRLEVGAGTPTGPALFHAAEVMQRLGVLQGVLVLVSDGESNCGETPVCDVAQILRDQGIELTVNSVGFDIAADSVAAEELKCISDATGGVYLEAGDSEELRDAIQRAAGAYVSITAEVPEQIPSVVGQGTSGETSVSIQVTNEAKQEAVDVRVALDFAGEDGVGGAILVPRPVRFLGNLGAEESRTVAIQVHPEAQLEGKAFRWSASVTSRNGAADLETGTVEVIRPDLSALGAVLSEVKDPVVMGDSYSAGEGAGVYLPGTNDAKNGNMCHRSDLTYAKLLYPLARNIACSGAVIPDLDVEQDSGENFVDPQLTALEGFMDEAKPPDAVFLTIGGNDISFGDVVKACAESPRCSMADYDPRNFGFGASINHNVKLSETYALGAQLVTAYSKIDAVLNSAEAVKKRGREAPIVVLPYARITPRDGTGEKGCQAGVSTGELSFLNDLLEALNLTIAVAVGQAEDNTRPIYFAKDVQEAFQPNHTICDDAQSYAVFLRTDLNGARRLADPAKQQETAHPNKAGYAAIASAVANWSRSASPVATVPLKTADEINLASGNAIVRALSVVTRTSVGAFGEAGALVSVSGDGFAPGSQAVVWLESQPVTVGAVIVDESGHAEGKVRLPNDAVRGKHHLVVTGLSAEGEPQTLKRSFYVGPAYSLEAGLLLLVGIALCVRGWRRRPRPAVKELS